MPAIAAASRWFEDDEANAAEPEVPPVAVEEGVESDGVLTMPPVTDSGNADIEGDEEVVDPGCVLVLGEADVSVVEDDEVPLLVEVTEDSLVEVTEAEDVVEDDVTLGETVLSSTPSSKVYSI